MPDEYIIEGGEPAAIEPEKVEQTPEETPAPAETAEAPEQTKEVSEEAEEEKREEEHKKKSGVQRLKAKLQAEAEARAKAEDAAMQLRRQIEERDRMAGKPVPPREMDFNTYEEFKQAENKYHEDHIEWRLAEERRNQAMQEHQRRALESQREFQHKMAAVHAEHADLADLLDSAREEGVPLTDTFHAFMQESTVPGDVLYHLAKNPEEWKRIASLSPVRQLTELGRIESRLESGKKTETPKPKTTSAPKPPTPVTSPAASVPRAKDGYEVY